MNNKINKIFNRKKFNSNDFNFINNYYSRKTFNSDFNLISKKIIIKNQLHNITLDCYKKRKKIKQKIELISKNNKLKNKYILILHGSFSTGVITDFSDIDLVLFVDFVDYEYDDFRKLHKLIYNLNKFIYNYDTLAHHGVEVFNINNFNNYDETILPLSTLEQSTLLNYQKDLELTINVNFNLAKKNSIFKFNEQVNNILNLKKKYYNYSPYRIKSMISVFFLICILKIQADESLFMYKKDSLIYVKQKKIFDSKIISEISTIRKNWRTKFFSKVIRMIFNLLLPLIPSLLIGQKVNIIIYNPFIYFSNKKIFLEIYNYIEKYKNYEKN